MFFFYIKARGITIKLSINKCTWGKLTNNHYLFWAGSFVCSSSGSFIQCVKQHFPCLYSCDWLFSPTEAGESASCGGASSLFTAVCVLTRGRLLRRRRRGVIQKRGRGQETGVRNDAEREPQTKKSTNTHIHRLAHTLTLWHLSPQSV